MLSALRFLLLVLLAFAGGAGLYYLTRPVPVEVVLYTVDFGTVQATVTNAGAGTVMACRHARLAPAVAGRVAYLPIREGSRVRGGDPLLGLWNEDLEARARLAASEAAAADAVAEGVCARTETAGREAERLAQTAARPGRSEEGTEQGTEEGVKGFVREALPGESGCRSARAAAQINRDRVRLAEAERERTLLRAPFAGVVAEVNGELGEFITPSPPGFPGVPVVDLIDDSCLYVSAPIDEVDAPGVRLGMPVCVTLRAFPGPRCSGRVRHIAPRALDRGQHSPTVEVEVSLERPDDLEGLLPGYSADLEIVREERAAVLRVPTEALLEGRRALVYDEATGRLVSRAVEVGVASRAYTEVRTGLEAGERVVTSVGRGGVAAGVLAVPDPESRR